jgi:3-oxoacyl-[acyl-carrier-protein] synthase-3
MSGLVGLKDSAALGCLLSAVPDLAEAGFRWHHVCGDSTTAYDLARAAVSQLGGRPGLDSPDAIIYATCLPVNANMGDPGDWATTSDVKHLMDLPASRLQADFRLAQALLAVEPEWQRVLCVTADRFPPGPVYEQAYNVTSDGATACTVSRARGQFKLVTQNTTPLAWHVLCRMLGIAADRVWSPSMPDVGHAIAADNMINLAELHASGRLRAGDLLLLPMAGFGMNWQCVILEATPDAAP